MSLYEYRCTVVRVVDGDTLHVKVDLGFDIQVMQTIRLLNINAPELNTAEGKKAKAYVELWIAGASFNGGSFTLHTVKDRREKYGRYLGDLITDDGSSLTQDLLRNQLAVPYMIVKET